jgi:hypothetical protein
MQLDVPDKFMAFVESLGGSSPGAITIALLKWATKNPSAAVTAVDDYYCLGRNAKSHFRGFVFWTGKYLPPEAVKACLNIEVEQHERRMWLMKAIAQMKKNGYKVVMPNGVECTITKRGDKHISEFTVQSVKVTVTRYRSGIATYIEELRKGQFFNSGVITLSIGNRTFKPYAREATILINAILCNTNPFVNAVMTGDE